MTLCGNRECERDRAMMAEKIRRQRSVLGRLEARLTNQSGTIEALNRDLDDEYVISGRLRAECVKLQEKVKHQKEELRRLREMMG